MLVIALIDDPVVVQAARGARASAARGPAAWPVHMFASDSSAVLSFGQI
jgi:hypothetical protein